MALWFILFVGGWSYIFYQTELIYRSSEITKKTRFPSNKFESVIELNFNSGLKKQSLKSGYNNIKERRSGNRGPLGDYNEAYLIFHI